MAQSKSFVDHVKKELECSVCQEQFSEVNEPKILKCLHTFCKTCLEAWLRRQREGELSCPTCRQVTDCSNNNINSLPSNLFYKQMVVIVEAYSGQAQETDSTRCGNCDEKKSLKFYCFDCNNLLCEDCTGAHKKWKSFRGHTLKEIGSFESTDLQDYARKASVCKKHKDELRFYCEKCNICICRDCAILEHRDDRTHNIISFEQALENKQSDITQKMQDVKSIGCRLRDKKESLERRRVRVLNSIDQTTDEVHRFADQWISLIRQYESSVTKELLEQKENFQAAFSAQMTGLDEKLTEIDSSLEFGKDVLERKNVLEIVNVEEILEQRFRDLLSSRYEFHNEINFSGVRFVPDDTLSKKNPLGNLFITNCDPALSIALGKGLTEGLEGEDCTFTIITNDSHGQTTYSEIDKVTVDIRSMKSGKITKSNITDLKNGRYVVEYKPETTGEFSVSITVAGETVKGSPFKLNVKESLSTSPQERKEVKRESSEINNNTNDGENLDEDSLNGSPTNLGTTNQSHYDYHYPSENNLTSNKKDTDQDETTRKSEKPSNDECRKRSPLEQTENVKQSHSQLHKLQLNNDQPKKNHPGEKMPDQDKTTRESEKSSNEQTENVKSSYDQPPKNHPDETMLDQDQTTRESEKSSSDWYWKRPSVKQTENVKSSYDQPENNHPDEKMPNQDRTTRESDRSSSDWYWKRPSVKQTENVKSSYDQPEKNHPDEKMPNQDKTTRESDRSSSDWYWKRPSVKQTENVKSSYDQPEKNHPDEKMPDQDQTTRESETSSSDWYWKRPSVEQTENVKSSYDQPQKNRPDETMPNQDKTTRESDRSSSDWYWKRPSVKQTENVKSSYDQPEKNHPDEKMPNQDKTTRESDRSSSDWYWKRHSVKQTENVKSSYDQPEKNHPDEKMPDQDQTTRESETSSSDWYWKRPSVEQTENVKSSYDQPQKNHPDETMPNQDKTTRESDRSSSDWYWKRPSVKQTENVKSSYDQPEKNHPDEKMPDQDQTTRESETSSSDWYWKRPSVEQTENVKSSYDQPEKNHPDEKMPNQDKTTRESDRSSSDWYWKRPSVEQTENGKPSYVQPKKSYPNEKMPDQDQTTRESERPSCDWYWKRCFVEQTENFKTSYDQHKKNYPNEKIPDEDLTTRESERPSSDECRKSPCVEQTENVTPSHYQRKKDQPKKNLSHEKMPEQDKTTRESERPSCDGCRKLPPVKQAEYVKPSHQPMKDEPKKNKSKKDKPKKNLLHKKKRH